MNERDLILPISYVPSLEEFLETLHIRPASFAAQIFTAVYDRFFVRSTDLRIEYERYYCVEYQQFSDYLELANEIYISPEELEKAHILKIKSPGGVLEEDYSDNVRDIVIECIRKLEDSHEG